MSIRSQAKKNNSNGFQDVRTELHNIQLQLPVTRTWVLTDSFFSFATARAWAVVDFRFATARAWAVVDSIMRSLEVGVRLNDGD